jgi:Asp-tRNA(Asn)/Glu-tRNA(Gln) amidotransferase A subunit family amidase
VALANRHRRRRFLEEGCAKRPVAGLKSGEPRPPTIGFRAVVLLPAWERLLITVNLLGLPAAAVPTGLSHGIPLGVQIIGSRYREDLCPDAAEVIEAQCGLDTPIDPQW